MSKRKNTPLSPEKEAELRSINDSRFAHNVVLEQLMVDSSDGNSKSSDILRKHGIVIIKNFVDHETAKKAGSEFIRFVEEQKIREKLIDQSYFETNDYLAQYGAQKLKSYAEYSAFHKPVIVIRRKDKNAIDGGMLDAFGFNKNLIHQFPKLQECYHQISNEYVRATIGKQARKDIRQQQLNIYLNDGVNNTRNWHVDSLFEAYKVFLYLEDCESMDLGPYGYVPGSHLKRLSIKRNLKENLEHKDPYSHEDVILSDEVGIPILAKAGTLVISVQNGVHRGYAQKENKRRVAMVDSYYK